MLKLSDWGSLTLCVLRVSFADLAPEEAVRLAGLPGEVSDWHTGGGFNFDVSVADEDFAQQVADAFSFLQEHGDDLKRLHSQPGIQLCLDFICYQREDQVSTTSVLPAELCRLAGTVGCDLAVSKYLADDA